MMTSIFLFLFNSVSMAGDPTKLSSMEEVKAIERAHVAVSEVKGNFRKALSGAIEKEGTKGAVGFCKVHPPKAANMKVGRTSHLLRNPKNSPPQWTESYLAKFSKMKPGDIPKSTIVPLSDKRLGYIEPIFVEPICLNCHGEKVEASVKKAILENYPEDKALGFKVGDFRGLLWLEMTGE
jgi:hypothetical protein